MSSGNARPQEAAEGRIGAVGHGSKTPAVRDRAVLALLSERSLSAAARKAGVAERTLRRWLADDDAFRRDLAQARRTVFEAGIGRAQVLSCKALDALEELLAQGEQPSVRLGAAKALLELAINRHDAAWMLDRLDQLEAVLENRGQR